MGELKRKRKTEQDELKGKRGSFGKRELSFGLSREKTERGRGKGLRKAQSPENEIKERGMGLGGRNKNEELTLGDNTKRGWDQRVVGEFHGTGTRQ